MKAPKMQMPSTQSRSNILSLDTLHKFTCEPLQRKHCTLYLPTQVQRLKLQSWPKKKKLDTLHVKLIHFMNLYVMSTLIASKAF